MDYLELSGATISERDKAFAQEFANFVNGSMCSPDQIGRELTRGAPLPATADVQGVSRLHEAAGIQLSAGKIR